MLTPKSGGSQQHTTQGPGDLGVSGFKETYSVSLKISYLASGLAKFSYLHSDADLHL